MDSSKLVSKTNVEKIQAKMLKWKQKRGTFVLQVEKYEKQPWGFLVYAIQKMKLDGNCEQKEEKIVAYLFTEYIPEKMAEMTLEDAKRKQTWQVDLWTISKNIYAFDPPSCDLFAK